MFMPVILLQHFSDLQSFPLIPFLCFMSSVNVTYGPKRHPWYSRNPTFASLATIMISLK